MKASSKKKIAGIVVSSMLVTAMATSTMLGSFTAFAANDGHAAPAFKTKEEALAAAQDLNERLTGEGSVLLKNTANALPMAKADGVTVFGSASQALQGGTGKVDQVLKDAGFKVNTTVITETTAADATAATVEGNKKVGIVVLKRGGGEGSDLAVATNELADDANENDGWEHKRLAINKAGKEVKHNQMLTAAEIAMIKKADQLCEKVVVVLNTSNAMEMYNLQNDEAVDSILWIGRPGTTGLKALPKLLTGEWNPSGKLVAEWYKDFTADPTWYNSIANVQNDAGSNSYILADGSQASSIGLHGVDYSEDIYIGYKYYETVYAEILAGNLSYNTSTKALTENATAVSGDHTAAADAWYGDNVVYPFGYGLSYTSFEMNIISQSVTQLAAADISSSIGNPAKVKTITLNVEVTNTGKSAGKEVVEIYSQAPYTKNGIEKASVNLVAYAKTKTLKPGEKQIVQVDVNLQDMASYDYSDANNNQYKGYELEEGTYNLYAANTSHVVADTEKTTVEIKGNAKLQLDDYSDNEITNLFSEENGRYNSIRKNDVDWNGDGKIDEKDKMFDKEQVLLSRANMVSTFPEAPVVTIDGKSVADYAEFNEEKAYAAGDVVKKTEVTQGVTGTSSVKYYKFKVAHPVGPWTGTDVEEVQGVHKGGLVVTDEFADLMDYYAKFDLNLWLPNTPYYNPAKTYEVGDKVGNTGTKDIYEVKQAINPVKAVDEGTLYSVGDYVRNGSTVYRVTAAIAAPTVKDNGEATDGIASQDYKEGDVIKYYSSGWGGVTLNTVIAIKDIAKGAVLSTRGNSANIRAFAAVDRLTKDNSVVVEHADYLTEVCKAVVTTDKNSGDYVYSDKLFMGDAGINGYLGNEDGLYDVTPDMMHGWSQMADADAQKEAIANGDWILFNELNGIKFTDKEVIKEGRFAGMTGEEVWLKFMNQWTWDDLYTACWAGGNNGLAVENLGIPAGGIQDSPTSFARTYTWCDNCSIASTWNVDLGYEQGRVTASLGLLYNTDKIGNQNTTRNDEWLNPAINFHRTPFSGRNNEYYGQDGYHAGWFAQAVVRGIQDTGVSSHLKHMFLNDQETNRNSGDLFAWVSEQALREIYVKPFQIGIQEGGAEGAMSAFARIGGVPTPVNDNMCNLLVRKEWGATEFMFHPDMYSPQANVASEDLMLRTGHNHAPGNNSYKPSQEDGVVSNKTWSGCWDADYYNELTGTKGGVYIGKNDEATGQETYYSNNQWYIIRYSAMIMYSEYANNSHSLNGILPDEYKGYEVNVNTDKAVVLDASFKQAEERADVVYSIVGNLPEGLSIDAKTGLITGKIATAGSYKVTVKAMADKWIGASADFTIVVEDVTGGGSGEDGVGVKDATINDKGELVLTLTDNTTINAGKVTGDGTPGGDGLDGVGIKDATINADGHLILTLTDDKTIDAGLVRGADGQNAEGGCGGSIAPTVISVSAAFALITAAVFVIRRRKAND